MENAGPSTPVQDPIIELFEFMTHQLRSLQQNMALIASAVESNPQHPDREQLIAAVEQLNHRGLHFPDYRLMCLMLGACDHYDQ